MKKEIIYYTCNTHDQKIDDACREQLLKAELPIISVSLNKKIDFGDTRIVIQGKRSPEMMHEQILLGLRASRADVIYLCESDVLYHPSHFDSWDLSELNRDRFFYNVNVWKYHTDTKKFTWTDDLQQVSGTRVNRKLALRFYERRNRQIKEKGFDGHYEAGPKTGELTENYMSDFPNVCIRHENTLTKTKKTPNDFRNKRYAKGWCESNGVLGWDLLTSFNF